MSGWLIALLAWLVASPAAFLLAALACSRRRARLVEAARVVRLRPSPRRPRARGPARCALGARAAGFKRRPVGHGPPAA